jgi:hypothetical protein
MQKLPSSFSLFSIYALIMYGNDVIRWATHWATFFTNSSGHLGCFPALLRFGPFVIPSSKPTLEKGLVSRSQAAIRYCMQLKRV